MCIRDRATATTAAATTAAATAPTTATAINYYNPREPAVENHFS